MRKDRDIYLCVMLVSDLSAATTTADWIEQDMRSRESRDRFIEDILSDADKARRWAAECGWEPGTGYCRRLRTPECQVECTFRFLRAAEAEQVRRGRQRRRPGPSELN